MKRICQKIVGILVIIVLTISFNMSLAATQSQLESQKKEDEQKRNEIENIKKEVQAQKSQVQKEVDSLANQIDSYQDQIDELDSKINDANQKIADAEQRINQAQNDYDKKQEMLEKRIVAIYEAGETSYLDVLLNSQSMTEFISKYYIVSEVAGHDAELLNEIQKQKQEIENAKQELENNKQTLTTSKTSKESVAKELKTAKAQKDAKVSQLSDEEKALQKEIDELKAHERQINAQIQKMKEEYDRQHPGSTLTPGWPVANNSIGTRYGVRGPYWSLGYHTGVDFPVGTGTPVYAISSGQVFDTGYNSAYGNFVEIYHGNNVYSFYAHASSVQVSKKQNVSKGQQIMLSGATGNVTGAHLHFEIRTPGSGFSSCVNPMPYLP